MIAVAVLLLRQDSADEPWMWTWDAENAKLESAPLKVTSQGSKDCPATPLKKLPGSDGGCYRLLPQQKKSFTVRKTVNQILILLN